MRARALYGLEIERKVVDEKTDYRGEEEEEGAAGGDGTLTDEMEG